MMIKFSKLFFFSIFLFLSGLFIKQPVFAQTATVSFTPPTSNITTNGSATFTINVANVQNFGHFQLTVKYSPNIVQVPTNGATVSTTFLASTGRTVTPINPIIDNTAGTVTFGAYSTGTNDTGPNGSGALGTVTFNAVGIGTSSLELIDTAILHADLNGTAQPTTLVNGSITVGSITATPTPTPTPTPRASATPIPSPSASPGTSQVNLKLRFEGIERQRTGSRIVKAVFIRSDGVRYPTTGTAANEVSCAADGSYSSVQTINLGLTTGTYDVYVNGPTHLVKKFTGQSISSGTVNLDLTVTTLLTADIVNDNSVNDLDYNQIIAQFGCAVGEPNPSGKTCDTLNADADLDSDVDIYDYSFLV